MPVYHGFTGREQSCVHTAIVRQKVICVIIYGKRPLESVCATPKCRVRGGTPHFRAQDAAPEEHENRYYILVFFADIPCRNHSFCSWRGGIRPRDASPRDPDRTSRLAYGP